MNRNPRLGMIAVTSLALGTLNDYYMRDTKRVKPLPNVVPDHRRAAKQWTCKRCGGKFTPHRSPTYCDRCQAERMRQ